MSDVIYDNTQTNLELTIQSYVKSLSLSQMAQVLEFIEYLNFKNNKEQANQPMPNVQVNSLPISHYAGMIKLPKTGISRNLMEFDVASMATDD